MTRDTILSKLGTSSFYDIRQGTKRQVLIQLRKKVESVPAGTDIKKISLPISASRSDVVNILRSRGIEVKNYSREYGKTIIYFD